MPPLPLPGDTVGLADAAADAADYFQPSGLLKVLKGINDAVGAVANWLQVAMVLVDAIEKALTGPGPDMAVMLADIDNKVNELVQLVPAGITDTKMLNITDFITKARGRLNTLLLNPPGSPYYGQRVNESQFFADCQDAVYIFADSTYWIRPFVPGVTYLGETGPETGLQVVDYDLPGNGQPPTTHSLGSSWVYDPQLALPAFACAITIFTSLTAIFNSSDPEALYPYCNDLATFLDKNYQTAVQGLVMVPVPSIDMLIKMSDAAPFGLLPGLEDGKSLPITIGGDQAGSGLVEDYWFGEIGAVDIYSPFGGAGWPSPLWPNQPTAFQWLVEVNNPGNIIGIYPALATLQEQMRFPVGWREEYPRAYAYCYTWFHLRVRIGQVARWKALYLTKGYGEIWKIIQKLRFMSAGQPGTPEYGSSPPTPPPETVDNNAHWRLTEILAIIDEFPFNSWPIEPPLVFDAPPPPDGGQQFSISRMSAWQVIIILLSTLDNSENHPTDEVPYNTPPFPRPLSLRKTIASVAV
jgi:hypothetical protein